MYTSLNHPSSPSSSSNAPPRVHRHGSVADAASGLWSDIKQVFRKSQTNPRIGIDRQEENRYDPPRYPGGPKEPRERPPTVSPEVAMDLLQMDAANVFNRLPERNGTSLPAADSSRRTRAARSALEAYRIRLNEPDEDLPNLLDLDSTSRSSEPRLISFDDASPSITSLPMASHGNNLMVERPSYPHAPDPLQVHGYPPSGMPEHNTRGSTGLSSALPTPSLLVTATHTDFPSLAWESGARAATSPSAPSLSPHGSVGFRPASPHPVLNTTSNSSPCTSASPPPLIGSNSTSPLSDQTRTNTATNLNLLDL